MPKDIRIRTSSPDSLNNPNLLAVSELRI